MSDKQVRILPYLPEIERLAAEVQRCSYEAGQAVKEYRDGGGTTDPLKPACAIEELYAAAVSVLLTTRAALSACGHGTRPIP